MYLIDILDEETIRVYSTPRNIQALEMLNNSNIEILEITQYSITVVTQVALLHTIEGEDLIWASKGA